MSLPNFTDGKEGVFENLPDPEYRAAAGISNSMLKAIALDGDEPGSPAHFVQAFNDPNLDSDALFIGRMVHSKILTPDEPLPGIIQIPETYPAPADCSAVKQKKAMPGDPLPWHGAAKFCKKWVLDQSAAGLRPMSEEQIKMMGGIVTAIANDPICQIIFNAGKSEVSLFKQHHRNDRMILRKARLDWVSPSIALVDIKTCQDARACEFDSVIWRRRYYVQAAYYLDLWNDLNPDDQKSIFVFIAVEKAPPFAIQIFQLSGSDIDNGRYEYRRNLSLVMECMATGIWPGYPTGVQEIKMRAPYNRKTILQD